MPTQVLISHPIWGRAVTVDKKFMTIKADKFEFAMEFAPYVYKKLEENPVFQQKLWDAAQSHWRTFTQEVNFEFYTTVELLKKQSTEMAPADFEKLKAKEIAACKVYADKCLKEHSSKMEKAVLDEWAKIRKQNRIANEYKIKTVFKSVGRVLTLGSSVLALVASGGTNVMAYYTLARTIAMTIDDLKSQAKHLDALGVEIKKECKTLSAKVQKGQGNNKKRNAANVISHALLGTSVVKSAKSVKKKLDIYKSRVAIMQQKQMKLGKEIKKLLDKVAKEKSKVDKVTSAKMQKLEKALNALLEKVSALGKRFIKAEGTIRDLDVYMKGFTTAGTVKAMNKITDIVTISASLIKIGVSATVLDAASASDAVSDIAKSLSKG